MEMFSVSANDDPTTTTTTRMMLQPPPSSYHGKQTTATGTASVSAFVATSAASGATSTTLLQQQQQERRAVSVPTAQSHRRPLLLQGVMATPSSPHNNNNAAAVDPLLFVSQHYQQHDWHVLLLHQKRYQIERERALIDVELRRLELQELESQQRRRRRQQQLMLLSSTRATLSTTSLISSSQQQQRDGSSSLQRARHPQQQQQQLRRRLDDAPPAAPATVATESGRVPARPGRTNKGIQPPDDDDEDRNKNNLTGMIKNNSNIINNKSNQMGNIDYGGTLRCPFDLPTFSSPVDTATPNTTTTTTITSRFYKQAWDSSTKEMSVSSSSSSSSSHRQQEQQRRHQQEHRHSRDDSILLMKEIVIQHRRRNHPLTSSSCSNGDEDYDNNKNIDEDDNKSLMSVLTLPLSPWEEFEKLILEAEKYTAATTASSDNAAAAISTLPPPKATTSAAAAAIKFISASVQNFNKDSTTTTATTTTHNHELSSSSSSPLLPPQQQTRPADAFVLRSGNRNDCEDEDVAFQAETLLAAPNALSPSSSSPNLRDAVGPDCVAPTASCANFHKQKQQHNCSLDEVQLAQSRCREDDDNDGNADRHRQSRRHPKRHEKKARPDNAEYQRLPSNAITGPVAGADANIPCSHHSHHEQKKQQLLLSLEGEPQTTQAMPISSAISTPSQPLHRPNDDYRRQRIHGCHRREQQRQHQRPIPIQPSHDAIETDRPDNKQYSLDDGDEHPGRVKNMPVKINFSKMRNKTTNEGTSSSNTTKHENSSPSRMQQHQQWPEQPHAMVLSVQACYTGPLRQGLPYGIAILRFENGDMYMGEVVWGEMHGQGTYRTSKGQVWRGLFQHNMFVGNKTVDEDDEDDDRLPSTANTIGTTNTPTIVSTENRNSDEV